MFDDFYEVFLADSHAGKEIHYAIRYQVYCQEKEFIDGEQNLKQERDEYDQQSIHFIARDKSTGQWVGALRIVLRDGRPLPLEHHCALNEAIVDTPSHRAVEMSRVCVLKEVRNQADSRGDTEGSSRRVEQSIMWGLTHAALTYSDENNIKKWYAFVTVPLERILNRAGFNTQRVSNICSHKAERVAVTTIPSAVLNCAIWQNGFSNGYRLYSELDSDQEAINKSVQPELSSSEH